MKQLFPWTANNEGQWCVRVGRLSQWALRCPTTVFRLEELRQSQEDFFIGEMTWESRETKAPRVHRGVWEDSCTEEPLEYLAEYTPAHACEETTQGQEKNHPKELERTSLSPHTRPGSVLPPINQTGKPYNSWGNR